MSVLTLGKPLAAERKSVPFQIRCSPSWLDRVQRAAEKLELSAAAYIRLVVTERMDEENVPKTEPPKRKPRD